MITDERKEAIIEKAIKDNITNELQETHLFKPIIIVYDFRRTISTIEI